jgi:hypothetical protein
MSETIQDTSLPSPLSPPVELKQDSEIWFPNIDLSHSLRCFLDSAKRLEPCQNACCAPKIFGPGIPVTSMEDSPS